MKAGVRERADRRVGVRAPGSARVPGLWMGVSARVSLPKIVVRELLACGGRACDGPEGRCEV